MGITRLFEPWRWLASGVLAGLLGASIAAAPGLASSRPPVDFSLRFGSKAPNTPARIHLHILYKDPGHPHNPNAKPPALTKVTIQAPRGTVFDGSAVPACRASDDQLQENGRAACPTASRVGGGIGSVIVGSGQPVVLDATLFNAGNAVIELFTFKGTDTTAAVDRARFHGPRTMVLHPPVYPGISEREFDFTYRPVRGAGGKAFITTPPLCPPSGVWTSRLSYTVTTGARYRASSTTPCARG